LFSVVIPTYNRAPLIERTLQSIFSQTFRNFEVIVVDDHSTDNTIDVLRQYVEAGTIRLYQQERNRERGSSRNMGMSLARGRYVTFLDSDDLMYPTSLEDAASFALARPDLSVFHNRVELITPSGSVIHRYRYPSLKNQHRSIALGNFLSCIGVFLRDDVYSHVRFSEDPDLAGSEDWELWLRVLSRYALGRIDKINSGATQHSGRSLSGEDDGRVARRKLRVIQLIRSEPELRATYEPYLGAMHAGALLYAGSAAAGGGHVKSAVRYCAQAVVSYPRALLWSRTWRMLALAARTGVRAADVQSPNH